MALLRRIHRSSVSRARVVAFLALGFLLGLTIGYTLMGTVHAVMERGPISDQRQGDKAGKAAGAAQRRSVQQQEEPPPKIHTLCPSNGSPYQNYQMRIAYATYQIMRGQPGGEKHAGFTRILHRTRPDELMEEVPTFRANPLQPKCDDWCDYPVADRADAVRQFLDASRTDPSLIKAPWLYLVESDVVFMKPLQLPLPLDPTLPPTHGWAFQFEYIKPMEHRAAMQKLYPSHLGKLKELQGTGPAPVLMLRERWEKVVPEWERLSAVVEADPEIQKELGWVREMYAFSAALALTNTRLDVAPAPGSQLIAQLPIDRVLGNAHAFHYTQPITYVNRTSGEEVWKFNKRAFTRAEDVRDIKPLPLPPEHVKRKYLLKEGGWARHDLHHSLVQMLEQMNRAIATLKPLGAATS